MNTAAKLSSYSAALALFVVGAYGAGTVAGSLATPGGHGDAHSGTVMETAADQPGGLASSTDGYTLTPADSTPTGGTFSFRITGRDGAAVTAFDLEHDKPQIQFIAEVPSAANYRLFLDFQHDGVVRTAEFTTSGRIR